MSKLSLRDLFAVVTIVALALWWWVDHRRMETQQANVEAENRRLTGLIFGTEFNMEAGGTYIIWKKTGDVHWERRDDLANYPRRFLIQPNELFRTTHCPSP
jgi:hypothetical protein